MHRSRFPLSFGRQRPYAVDNNRDSGGQGRPPPQPTIPPEYMHPDRACLPLGSGKAPAKRPDGHDTPDKAEYLDYRKRR